MLRRKTLIKDLISTNLLDKQIIRTLNDFLRDRKSMVEVDGEQSEVLDVNLGCVQGSILGPKLFNVYTRHIPFKLTPSAHITTYADDSYVILSSECGKLYELMAETELCLTSHINYLRGLRMVVNQGKTEVMFIPSCNLKMAPPVICCGDHTLSCLPQMKVLGVTLDSGLTWLKHISTTINKVSRMTGALKFIRKRLSKDKFIPVLTSQFYGTCYYASQAWLGAHTRKIDIIKLNSLHYKVLRIAIND